MGVQPGCFGSTTEGSMSVTNNQTCEWSNIVGLTRVTVSLLKGAPRFVERHSPSAWRSISVDVCNICLTLLELHKSEIQALGFHQFLLQPASLTV